MRSKTWTFVVILSFFVQLGLFALSDTATVRGSDKVLDQDSYLLLSVPEKHRLTLVSIISISMKGRPVGGLAAYDDVTTSRSTDYVEVYNISGDLLGVSWFDQFGIQRMAVDRGLLRPEAKLEGVLVMLMEEDSV
jgi:hypothetical protein